MAKIVVCGYMIRHPVAGNLMAFFHYLLGLSKLGHEVVYLEESGWSGSCYDPATQAYSDDPAAGLKAVRSLLQRFDVAMPVGFVNRESRAYYGIDAQTLDLALASANLLLNIGGVCWLPEFEMCQRLALVDMDPLFTQLGQFASEGQQAYDVRFSYGANIGQPQCSIPTNETVWLPVVPPVVPEIWSVPPDIPNRDTFTTIANWKAYGGIEHNGVSYGQKREEFLRLIDLPKQSAQPLELALSGVSPAGIAQLAAAGWQVRDSKISHEFDAYQSYIMRSKGEFSVAKQAYVKTRSGWFSDRSVCYLAAGRPTVLQDTGFSDWLDTGWGVVAFSSLAEAVEGLAHVHAHYEQHSQAARTLAKEVFGYRRVLPDLLSRAMSTAMQTQPICADYSGGVR